MSLKSRVTTGAVMAVVLLAAYGVAQTTKDQLEGKMATVTATWSPAKRVRIIVRVAVKDRVRGTTYLSSPFTETYPVKRGDAVLIAIDPIQLTDINIDCSIAVTGQPTVTGHGGIPGPDNGHTVCQTTVN